MCLVKTKSAFEINYIKKRDVTMLHAIWLGEIAIRHRQVDRFAGHTEVRSPALLHWPRTHDEDIHEPPGALPPIRAGGHVSDADKSL